MAFVFGLILVPAVFMALCFEMAESRVHWLCYPAYFFLFGIVGGWCIAVGLSSYALVAVCVVFLMLVAPIACLCASIALHTRRGRGRFENVAMVLGYCYSGLMFTGLVVGQLRGA